MNQHLRMYQPVITVQTEHNSKTNLQLIYKDKKKDDKRKTWTTKEGNNSRKILQDRTLLRKSQQMLSLTSRQLSTWTSFRKTRNSFITKFFILMITLLLIVHQSISYYLDVSDIFWYLGGNFFHSLCSRKSIYMHIPSFQADRDH